MMRWFLTVVVWVASSSAAQPVFATTTSHIYAVHRTDKATTSLPGTAVAGLPGIRLLTSHNQLSKLTILERQSIQKNVVYHAMFTPNDPLFSLQWNLQAMNVPAAWDIDQVPPIHGGDPRIVVAVLDTGLASTLLGGSQSVPDIVPETIWTNTDEVPGDGIDNDHNGHVDDIHGWNFVDNTAQPFDTNGHGTHVSGVIAAGTNNSIATAGIAHQVTIMPLKVLDQTGIGSTLSLTAAVNYAIRHGASIINLSLGGDEDDPIFHQAIQAAVQQGIVVISAAGNTGTGVVSYPARYAEVIGVGATNTDRTKASYSNYGAEVSLVAPGGNTALDLNADGQPDGIPSQTCTDKTCTAFTTIYLSGTSQSASEVSAVAALLASCGAAPGNIRNLLTSTAVDLGAAGRDDVFGYGLVDAAAAITAAGCASGTLGIPGKISGVASITGAIKIQAQQPSPFTRPVFSWTGPSGAAYMVTWKKGNAIIYQGKQTAVSYSPTLKDEGQYTMTVSTIDALNQSSTQESFDYRYQKPVIILSQGSTMQLLNAKLEPIRTLSSKLGQVLSVGAGTIGKTFAARVFVAAQPRGSHVELLDTRGKILTRVQPFGTKYSGTITTAVVRLATGDSKFVAATQTQGANITWYSADGKVLGKNLVFAKYTGGVNLATGDLDGDGNDEVIVAQAAGSEIRVYSGAQKKLNGIFPRGKKYTHGWSIASGDTDGDGAAEILATPNIPSTTSKVLFLTGAGQEKRHLTITGSTAGPMLLEALDITGDGIVEIITAPQRGAGLVQVRSAGGKVLGQRTVKNTPFRSLTSL